VSAVSAEATLEALPIAGFSRRRVGFAVGTLITVWVVVVFARQVGEAAAAQTRADEIRQDNAALADQVAALDRERTFIQTQPFVTFEARAYGLGASRERPFSLAPDAAPLASDAPGSAAVRVGAPTATPSPLESWLSLLFGPSR
jgi:cell division protein FtsB